MPPLAGDGKGLSVPSGAPEQPRGLGDARQRERAVGQQLERLWG